MIEIDGSQGEGGGQILRTALAFAALLKKQIRISKIRQGRPVPGLKAQHLAGVKAISEICGASVEGLQVGSTSLVFDPGRLRTGTFRFDIGTAGSVSLVLQTLMPVLPFLPGSSRIEVTGGTDVKWSPPIDYVDLVVLPVLRKMGYDATIEVLRRGHYPRGGGEIVLRSKPVESLDSVEGLEREGVKRIFGVSHSRRLPVHVAKRQAESAEHVITASNLPRPEIVVDTREDVPSLGSGSGIVLCLTGVNNAIIGADSLGDRSVPAEKVGEIAGEKLVSEARSGTFLDEHMGDIIIPYLVLARGTSQVSVSRVTQHLLTNLEVAKLLADARFDLTGQLGERGILRVNGMSFTSQQVSVSSRE